MRRLDRHPKTCKECGYDLLAHDVGEICPECGIAIRPKLVPDPKSYRTFDEKLLGFFREGPEVMLVLASLVFIIGMLAGGLIGFVL